MRKPLSRMEICASGVLEGWFVYCAFTATEHGLVKIGISEVPQNRLAEIHHNSPFPIKRAVWSFVGRKNKTRELERSLHYAFRHRNTRGEWFKFDYSKPDDKAEFNTIMKACFIRQTGKAPDWKECNEEETQKMLVEKVVRYHKQIRA